jgi:hypothetical protein
MQCDDVKSTLNKASLFPSIIQKDSAVPMFKNNDISPAYSIYITWNYHLNKIKNSMWKGHCLINEKSPSLR